LTFLRPGANIQSERKRKEIKKMDNVIMIVGVILGFFVMWFADDTMNKYK